MLEQHCLSAERVVRGESCGISANADLDMLVKCISAPAAGALSSARWSAKAYLVSKRYSKDSVSRAEFVMMDISEWVPHLARPVSYHLVNKQKPALSRSLP